MQCRFWISVDKAATAFCNRLFGNEVNAESQAMTTSQAMKESLERLKFQQCNRMEIASCDLELGSDF